MNDSNALLKNAHTYCTDNKRYLDHAETCGCFYCLKIFSPTEITFWLSEFGGQTAICPYCSIDSVLPDMESVKISEDFLAAMHTYWFSVN
jgi:hypothetical protein